MRLSVQLDQDAYRRLGQWTLDAGSQLGARVTHVAVFRALLAELLADPDLQGRVLDRLRRPDPDQDPDKDQDPGASPAADR